MSRTLFGGGDFDLFLAERERFRDRIRERDRVRRRRGGERDRLRETDRVCDPATDRTDDTEGLCDLLLLRDGLLLRLSRANCCTVFEELFWLF